MTIPQRLQALVDETVDRANSVAESTTDPAATKDAILRHLRTRFEAAKAAADYKFPEEDPRR